MAQSIPSLQEEKKAQDAAAWAEYRVTATRLSRSRMSWSAYLDADERAWRKYLAAVK